MPTRTTLNSSALRALPRSSVRPARILPRSRVAAQPSVGPQRLFDASAVLRAPLQAPHPQYSDYSSTPDASTSILLQTLPNIPRYGFTTHAFLQAAPSSSSSIDPEESLKRSRMLSTLFPGPPSVFDSRLFTAWNTVCDLSVLHDIAPEAAIEALQKGQAVGKGIFPHETLLPNIPNPYPLFDLTSNFISTLLTHPSAQLRTGWIDPDGPEWYAIRTRLTLAYTAATLHAASQSVVHFQDTQRLFGRIVKARILAWWRRWKGWGRESRIGRDGAEEDGWAFSGA
ncbi:uncharacterized protein UTRI_02365 [Ustilago trichophora]|uniref:Uncharacterized protein n=1 Tax=Ustilago trichophora TaxID=86804 RepID=A0A5C3E952_9BASI|nr:uncharacterized protein UTRI_02365 [Ustilago trichophora]